MCGVMGEPLPQAGMPRRKARAGRRFPIGLELVAGITLGLVGLSQARGQTSYYYDALGRQVASTRINSQGEQFTFDSADNRATLLAYQIASPNQAGLLTTGQTLVQNETITSTDNRFTLTLVSTGNLILSQGSTSLWSSGTSGKPAARVVMLSSGDLQMYDPNGALIWHTGPTGNGSGNPYLAVQTDGNLVVYNAGAALWASNTCCH